MGFHHRNTTWQKLKRFCGSTVVHIAILACLALIITITITPFFIDQFDYKYWMSQGCHKSAVPLTRAMNATYEEARLNNLLVPDLGNPINRRPRTAVLNFVRFHTEVAASLVFHFTKMNHDVDLYTFNDGLDMDSVIEPTRGSRKTKRFQHFFKMFYTYDVIAVATFPTCHLATLQALAALDLPQRFVGLVHNPDELNDTEVATFVADASMRLLTIAPHISKYASEVLKSKCTELIKNGVRARDLPASEKDLHIDLDWIVPIFPVLFQEECKSNPKDASALTYPWPRLPWSEAVVDEENPAVMHLACNRTQPDGWAKTGTVPPFAVAQGKGERQGFCIQGKVDPARRNYQSLFEALQQDAARLVAANYSLVILGKNGGKAGSNALDFPEDLISSGLVKHYSSLPFPEYYDLLHSCVAVLPSFNSDSYYVSKGSSSIAASIITGTPLIATPKLLAAYHFLDESSVYLMDDDGDEIEATMAVLSMPDHMKAAKVTALASLRRLLYDRNLFILQRQLGERFMTKRIAFKGTQDEKRAAILVGGNDLVVRG